MIEFSEGLEGYGKLRPRKEPDKSEKKGEDVFLSQGSGASGKEGAEPKSDMVKAEAFYGNLLYFTIDVLDKVAEGKEDQIKAEDIQKKADEACEYFFKSVNPDDLVRIVSQQDEYENNYLYNHSVNVCFLSIRVARELNFSRSRLSELIIASLFHDIGMMKVPMDIWNKDGVLNKAEYEEVQKHTLYGEEIFKKFIDVSEVVPLAIGQHHERPDGSGYPRHLKKDDTHYLARLISLIDRYAAQTHTRLWRPRFLPDKAIQQILDNEPNSYDMHFMKAMLRQISIFPVGSWVRISSGEIGNVIRTNPDTPMRPVISIIFDRKKSRLEKSRTLDLSKQLLIYVEECIDPKELRII